MSYYNILKKIRESEKSIGYYQRNESEKKIISELIRIGYLLDVSPRQFSSFSVQRVVLSPLGKKYLSEITEHTKPKRLSTLQITMIIGGLISAIAAVFAIRWYILHWF